MRLVVQHGRYIPADLAQCTLLDDNECHTCRSKVLLCTTVDNVVLADIYRAAQYIRTHIGYERYIAFLLVDFLQLGVADFRAEDGVVGRDMEIVSVLRYIVIIGDRVRAGGNLNNLAETFGFLDGFLAPHAGVQIRGFLLQHIERHHAELQRCTTSQKQHAVAFRYTQQLFEQRFRLVHYGLEILGAVADLQYRQTLALKVQYGFSGLLDYFLRQDTWSCIKVIFFHDFRNLCLLIEYPHLTRVHAHTQLIIGYSGNAVV